MTVPNATFNKVILIPDHTYDYISRGIPSLNIAGYNVYEFLLLHVQPPHVTPLHAQLLHITPLHAQTHITTLHAPSTQYYSITCPNRPILLHYMPQPPHITSLNATTTPYYSITCHNYPILLHYMPQTAPHYSITCPKPPHITSLHAPNRPTLLN